MTLNRSYISRRRFLVSSAVALASPALVKSSAGILSAGAAPRNSVKTTNKKTADLVIIGGGGSGLTAAVAAAEQGVKKIVVLESLTALGGNSIYPSGLFGADSKVLKQLGTGMQMTKDEAFKVMMDYGRWRLNAMLVRTLIDGSGKTIDWLGGQGVDFGLMPRAPGRRGSSSRKSTSNSGGGSTNKKMGSIIVQTLVKRCVELGVQTLTQTRAKQLIKDKDGRIRSVIAEQDKTNLEISAKSFIIATGGFAGNNDMIKKYIPPFQENDDIFVGGIPHKGDGIRMVEELGACLEPHGATEISVVSFPESPYLPFITRKQSVLSINRKGKRIPDNTNNVWFQPEKTAYIMFDEKIKQTFYKQEIPASEAKVFGTWPWLEKKRALTDIWKNADRDLNLFAKKDKVKITNSWKEMAGWIGSSTDVLEGTIKEYNEGCDNGNDLFCKDKKYLLPLRTPPYYAIKSTLNLLVTHGVIKTNSRMQVLDTNYDPIPGLFVAGDDIGGVDEDVYGSLGGHSSSFAFTSGRLAGLNAASFIANV